MSGKKLLCLEKDGRKFVFRYRHGEETDILDELARLADDPGSDIDWVDAATLSFQAAHHAALSNMVKVDSPVRNETE